MDYREHHEDRCVVVEPKGRIDSSNAQIFTDTLKQAVEKAGTRVVVDLCEVAYITSAGFRSLLIAAKHAHKNDCSFRLCRVEGKIYQLFELGGFFDLFEVDPDRRSAIDA